jgi:hypothetical protein
MTARETTTVDHLRVLAESLVLLDEPEHQDDRRQTTLSSIIAQARMALLMADRQPRETTLGALTAADLGKRVVVGGEWPADGELLDVRHESNGHGLVWTDAGVSRAHSVDRDPTTPVTVYDEGEA